MKKEVRKIGFSFSKITTEQFAIIEENFSEEADVRMGINLHFAADEKNRMVAIFARFVFDIDEKQFLIIEAGGHFTLEEEVWNDLISEVSSGITLPKGFMCHLAMLTIGTTRGILHAKTEGTCYNKFIIPAINVTELIPEDITFNF